MNWTWPGRAHLLFNADVSYVTVWLFCWRLHWCNRRFLQGEISHAKF